jgi:sugar porter (SP) family MFS transporter
MTRYLCFATIVAALGGLLFGFDTAVINGTTAQLETAFGFTEANYDYWGQSLTGLRDLLGYTEVQWGSVLASFLKGFTIASALIGTILGAMFISKPSDRFGRKQTLIWIASFLFISALGSAIAWDCASFVIFRFIGGIGVGGASVASPMYIAEISPAKLRGRLVAVFQFAIVFGILLAFFSNYLVGKIDFGANDWRWMFGMECFPAAAFFALLFFNPRSPRWLVSQNRIDEARAVLDVMGADTPSVAEEIAEIRKALAEESEFKTEPLFQRKYFRPLWIAAAIAILNQLSGINVVMYYSGEIFQMAGVEKSNSLLQTIFLGGINFVVTLLAMAVIDRLGRRILLIVGSIGYIVSLFAMAAVFYTKEGSLEFLSGVFLEGDGYSKTGQMFLLVGMLLFVASHAFGCGAVIWVYLSEIFPNKIRARGQAFASSCLWIFCALITWFFPVAVKMFSPGAPFLFFGVCMTVLLLWSIFIMIETKNVPLEEIHNKLGIES